MPISLNKKPEQLYIQSTYEKLDEITRKIREEGNHANIIIHEQSRLSAYRHLNRIPYRALIEYIQAKNSSSSKTVKTKVKSTRQCEGTWLPILINLLI